MNPDSFHVSTYFWFLTWVYFPIFLITVMVFPWYRYIKYPKASMKIGKFFLLLALSLLPFFIIVSMGSDNVEVNLSRIGIGILIPSAIFSLLLVIFIKWLEKLTRHSK